MKRKQPDMPERAKPDLLAFARGTRALRADLLTVSRGPSDCDSDRMRVDITAASFTSFNSEEGFGSPAPRRNKDRPTVFDMEDNDLKVTCRLLVACRQSQAALQRKVLAGFATASKGAVKEFSTLLNQGVRE